MDKCTSDTNTNTNTATHADTNTDTRTHTKERNTERNTDSREHCSSLRSCWFLALARTNVPSWVRRAEEVGGGGGGGRTKCLYKLMIRTRHRPGYRALKLLIALCTFIPHKVRGIKCESHISCKQGYISYDDLIMRYFLVRLVTPHPSTGNSETLSD